MLNNKEESVSESQIENSLAFTSHQTASTQKSEVQETSMVSVNIAKVEMVADRDFFTG